MHIRSRVPSRGAISLTCQVATAAPRRRLKVRVFDVGEAGRGDQRVGKGDEGLLGAVSHIGFMILPLRGEGGWKVGYEE